MPETSNQSLSGRCFCGAVHYECGPPVSSAGLCHCKSCRRIAGAHVVAWTSVRRDAFRFTRGAPRLFASSAPVVRSFCGECGTALTYQHADDRETLDVTVATLDAADAIAPADHLWMQDALAWDRPCDALPQYRTTRAAGKLMGA